MAPTQLLERTDQVPHSGSWLLADHPPAATLLGDERAQRAGQAPGFLRPELGLSPATSASLRLEALKRRHFTPEGKSERVERALAALRSFKPIDLDAEAWRWIAEDVDLVDIGLP